MSATSFIRSTALAGQGLSSAGTESRTPSREAAGPHRPSRLELQAVLAHAQARKASEAQAAIDKVPVVGLGFPTHLFPHALRGNVSPAHFTDAPPTPPPTPPYTCTPAVTSRSDTWLVGGDEADLSLPSTPFSTPAEHMYIPGKTRERPSLFAMPEFTQDGGQTRFGLGIAMRTPDEPVFISSAFPGPRIAPRHILEDIASDPIVTPGELTRRNFPLTPGAPLRGAATPSESGRYFPLTPGVPVHAVATAGSEPTASNFHRTPGAPLYRQPSRALLEGLLGRWGSSIPMSRGSSLTIEEDQIRGPTPFPTPPGVVEVFIV
ncbi:hypothetical protein FOMPIDRAFT_1013319 [Fomitopsis schrenkii]|uniref:Uncharacterized protein n=1 Tax=Fomitopsis schrenkii TaxID=2126942 RepID=S8EKC3_FOMSC|nr:hypothetical protein FOMPIDRAFT_1013319 [Fomitopsis schrenkii]